MMMRMLQAKGIGVAQTLVDAGGQRDRELPERVKYSSGRAARDSQLAYRAQHVVGYRLEIMYMLVYISFF